MCAGARNLPVMQRLLLILAGLVTFAALGALLILASPPAQNAGAVRPAPTPGAPLSAGEPPAVALQKLPGAFSQPVYLTAPRGDTSRLFVVEKTGAIRIIKEGAVLPKPFLDISGQVSRGGEQGLLSMAFDPRYAANRRFTSTTRTPPATRAWCATGLRDRSRHGRSSSARVLLRMDQPYDNHNGGQLQFGPDGLLYVGMGDGGTAATRRATPRTAAAAWQAPAAQRRRSPVRVGIYAKGLRNPWRFSFDRSSGALWIGDVGQGRP